ncbi:MAG: PASTA domain-containing protein [Terrimonas sp.]|nr:PASTA domain-containing protein [Terrimonas sp.]
MKLFEFITKRPLWVNILAAILLVVIMLFVFVYSLNFITKHNKSMTVPDVVGKTLDDARKILSKEGFGTEIVDSTYIDTLPPFSVIRQIPEGDAVVKIDRTVYVTINRGVPPFIEMPNLVGFSYRSAEMQLKNMGLRMGDTSSKPDFAKNSVLEQSIPSGTKIRMGTSVSLVLGDGVGNLEYPVPSLIGNTFQQAKAALQNRGINIFVAQAVGVLDTSGAFIYRQNPQKFDDEGAVLKIRPGQMIEVWLQTEKPVADTIKLNEPQPIN